MFLINHSSELNGTQNEELMAYFVGIICGDGYVVSKSSLIEIKDEYFDFLIDVYIPMIKRLFNKTPTLTPETNKNAYRCFFCSSYASNLLKSWNIVSPKTFTVCMPNWIRLSSLNIKTNFVRGAMDSDGNVNFSKNKSILNYPTVAFDSRSKKFAEDIQDVFSEVGINSKLTFYTKRDRPMYQVRLFGFVELQKFMKNIGFKSHYKFRKAMKLLKYGVIRASRSIR